MKPHELIALLQRLPADVDVTALECNHQGHGIYEPETLPSWASQKPAKSWPVTTRNTTC